MTLSDDQTYMRRAIALARAKLGRTAENPAVGCVIVRDGEIIGEGATGDGGRPHAEEVALDQAGPSARGATAYVTLEPCGARSSGAASCG
ncbi:MAG: ribD, partial [Phenylobacterium sp.]|nr:ribD [Phenylobacterium sp.]